MNMEDDIAANQSAHAVSGCPIRTTQNAQRFTLWGKQRFGVLIGKTYIVGAKWPIMSCLKFQTHVCEQIFCYTLIQISLTFITEVPISN